MSNTTFWLINAGQGGVLAEDWLEDEIITIGWDIGNIKEMSNEEIKKKSRDSQMTRFVGAKEDGMKEGDVVIAYAPERNIVIGVAEIVSEPYYMETHGLDLNHPYQRDVEWEDLGTPVNYHDLPKDLRQGGDNQIWNPQSLVEFTGDIDRVRKAVKKTPQINEIKENIFSPESEEQVQKYIYQNFDDLTDLEYKNLIREASINVGNIDILAEKTDGEKVVVEIKNGTAGDKAVGQILGYINSLKEDNKIVKGILVAEDFKERARKALKQTNVKPVKFEMKLNFKKV